MVGRRQPAESVWDQSKKACHSYRHVVLDGEGQRLWEELRQQIFLGNEQFIKMIQAEAQFEGDTLGIRQVRRRAPSPSLALSNR